MLIFDTDVDKRVILIFLAWLTLLLAVGWFSVGLPTSGAAKCTVRHQLPYYRWDSFWYTSIARSGYAFSTEHNSSIAFFPLYPLLIRATHGAIGGHEDRLSLGLNVLLTFFSVLFLYRLARLDFADRPALTVVAVFLFFPPAYFFLSGYPEALFVFLAIASLYSARQKRWALAGLAAALLALTKPYGIFLWPTLLLEYGMTSGWNPKVFLKRRDWWPLLLPPLAFGGFVLYNWFAFRTPFAFLDAQRTWGRSLADPAAALIGEAQYYLGGGHLLSGSRFPYLVYLASLAFSVVAFRLSWRRVRRTYLVFPGLILAAALLTGTLTSFGRYMLLGFPILFGPAVYLAERKKLLIVYLGLSILALAVLASLFVRCYPVE